MRIRKLALFLLYALLFELVFSSSLPHLCPNDQALALFQFNHTFTINLDASSIHYYPKTVKRNRSTNCCSWGGVECDETPGQVIELDLSRSQFRGKFHSNSSLFKLSNLKRLDLSENDFSESLISPKFGGLSSLTHLDLSYSCFTGSINKCVADQLSPEGLMQQPYAIAAQLLDNMTTINRVWYTREDQVSMVTFQLSKEQVEKDNERDQNMAKIMTQLDILSKNVVGVGARGVNVVGVRGANLEKMKF
ncbi:hypothetical protein MTR67_052078 [Solanum verrucosum]|uniref:Leucine-rich repeat-containing N-terminal plant-type domain-containing protein n=1 Tax=Solanum verrucosum TaxID=315347 RepID=A0AAF0V8M4_SOLVR|nr:hypothetical protein MTR67_052078 [Solanum verrucosum]